MTEPEVAGSDPTLIQTRAVRDGDDWVINGHKWFISGARGAQFAILIARTEDDPEIPQAANIGLPRRPAVARAGRSCATSRRWPAATTTARSASATCACRDENMLGGRGQGHLLGQARLGPARLAHCMRWIGQAEMALDMMVDRVAQPLRPRLAAWPRSRASSG